MAYGAPEPHPRSRGSAGPGAVERVEGPRPSHRTPMPPDPTEPEYSSRQSLFHPTFRWRLEGDALVVTPLAPDHAAPRGWAGRLAARFQIVDGGAGHPSWPERMPLMDITEIRVRFDPTRFDTNRYRCDLKGSGGANATLFSTSAQAPMVFRDQAASFSPFISALVERTQRVRPQVRIGAGLSGAAFVLEHGAVLLAVVALVSVLDLAGVPALGSVWVKGLVVAGSIGPLLLYSWRNRPRDLSLPLDPNVAPAPKAAPDP